nr:MAG TPA: hypothetical protein [Caudoviricetes sp.]
MMRDGFWCVVTGFGVGVGCRTCVWNNFSLCRILVNFVKLHDFNVLM